ncbi:MAG: sigma 54-interacting transcriptional regulator, partial [Bacteroidota bacterium]
AIPKDLANSELFGHIKGSFTGAINDKVGVFEQANGGTLFLDEIGNLTHAVQTKLLRVFQEKVVTKLGDTKPKKVDVRIIAATNEDLTKEVEEKNFREDLFHRINEFKVYLPSLRERPEDIPVFAEHFLKQANKALKRNVKGFDEQVIRAFTNYPWHGNLRELNNVVKRSVLLSPGEYVTINALPGEIKNNPYLADITPEPVYHQEQVTSLDLKQASVEAEKRIIMNALSDANFNKTKAAKLLNIDRKTLYNKIKQFNINLD